MLPYVQIAMASRRHSGLRGLKHDRMRSASMRARMQSPASVISAMRPALHSSCGAFGTRSARRRNIRRVAARVYQPTSALARSVTAWQRGTMGRTTSASRRLSRQAVGAGRERSGAAAPSAVVARRGGGERGGVDRDLPRAPRRPTTPGGHRERQFPVRRPRLPDRRDARLQGCQRSPSNSSRRACSLSARARTATCARSGSRPSSARGDATG